MPVFLEPLPPSVLPLGFQRNGVGLGVWLSYLGIVKRLMTMWVESPAYVVLLSLLFLSFFP